MMDLMNHPWPVWLGGAALLFLIGSGVIAGLVSDLRERRFRRLCAQRSAFVDHEWVERFYPEFTDFAPMIRRILEAMGEVYGVPPGKLRPEDALQLDYGFLRPLVLDEPLSVLLERLRNELPDAIESPATWQLSSPTVDRVIRYIIALGRDRRASNH